MPKTNTAIVNFPAKELDLCALDWIEEKNQRTAREKAARRYSATCKRNTVKEEIMGFLSVIGIFCSLAVTYIAICMF